MPQTEATADERDTHTQIGSSAPVGQGDGEFHTQGGPSDRIAQIQVPGRSLRCCGPAVRA